jgi:Cytochrome oxidase complex assembly protein 1
MSVPPPPPPQQPYSYTPPPQPVPPQQKSSGCLKWLLAGCGVLIVICVIGIAAIFFVVFGAIKRSDVYRGAFDRAASDPRVIAALGTPVERGFWVKGRVNIDTNGGHANIDFPISGPKAKAQVHAVATRDAEKWTYTTLVVTPENGPPIDLLSGGGGTGDQPDRPLKF